MGSTFDVLISGKYQQNRKLNFAEIKNVELHLHGMHNILNTLSAIAIGIELSLIHI